MKPVARPADAGKWEVLRRLRYGDVLKLIRSRYGAVPPDDDAGRPDVMELLFLASMAPTGAEEKVRHAIDLYAPWMPTDEVESLIQHLSVTITKRCGQQRSWVACSTSTIPNASG
jgi:hypothetical protein